MNRIDRLFAITLLLQSRGRVRAKDLAAWFEVSERTIYRDIGALSESGVPVISLPGEGYELMEGFYLPPLLFTPAEASALFLGAQMLASHATGRLPASAQQALDKIAAILPQELRVDMQRLGEIVQFVAPNRRFDLDHPLLATLQQAIRERRVVRLCYHSYSSNEVTDREVEPQALAYTSGAWYVNGYCRLRQGERAFRLDRIDGLELLKKTFKPRHTDRPQSEFVDVSIRFRPEVLRWVRERQHYAFVEESTAPDGSAVMVYRVKSLQEIMPWLLGWVASAELLAPERFRREIRQEILKLADSLT